ncbi:hypothetical protein LZ32DRAFT_319961 [Colletotrichum eremochloae]|nr:hypothetical protein LZ32DRAFT_319961 [Colletotrichum eremochloae]
MDQSSDYGSTAPATRRRSIETMTEMQMLVINSKLTSTDMFPSTFTEEMHSPMTTPKAKEADLVAAEDGQENDASQTPTAVTPDKKYLSGVKLVVVITCVILAAWLMFLDNSIIVTVRG